MPSVIGHRGLAYSEHVMQGNVFCHCHNQRNLSFNGLLDCGRGLVSCDIDRGGIRLELFRCLCVLMLAPGSGRKSAGSADRANRGQHRKAQMFSATARRHPSNNVGAPSDGVFCIRRGLELKVSSWIESTEGSRQIPDLLACEPLENYAGMASNPKTRERL